MEEIVIFNINFALPKKLGRMPEIQIRDSKSDRTFYTYKNNVERYIHYYFMCLSDILSKNNTSY